MPLKALFLVLIADTCMHVLILFSHSVFFFFCFQMDPDVIIVTSYETAIRAGYNFLSVFLQKCTMKGEDDYRPLFENFVHDLLSTVNKPEWPSSELLLSLLGRILVS